MSGNGSPLTNLSDRWTYAFIGGIVALPFTALGYWQTESELPLSPVLFGGLLAGHLARRRTGEGRGVGLCTGLVGGLPVVRVLFDILAATSALAGPPWFVASATAITVGFTVGIGVFGFGLAALAGEVGARIGTWAAGRRPGQRRPGVEL